uniref:CUB-like domain-containing protein n=1 Tax=Panagrolaimus sp. ES5 TaxID=591445 RepID=A0AC34F5E0_9BILA
MEVYSFTDTVTPDVITPGLYFSGTNFNLTFSNQWSNSSNSGFFLLVSAFTPSTIPIPSGCREPNTTGSTTIFTNIDYNSGYQPYQHCENNFTIPANFEVSVAITQPFYEACCDILSIKYGGNSNQISLTNGISAVYKLNHNIGEAKLVFDSDGNNQQAGYLAVVESYKCVCGPQKTFVQCDGQTGIFPTGSGLYYCDNMNCNYQIVQNASCPNAYISVFVSHVLRPQIDHLILKSNGQFNKDFTNNTKYFSPAYISETFYYSMPKNNVTFDFTSGQNGDISTDSKIWSAYIKTVPSPKFINITLDQNKSKHVQWLADMNENEALRVCAKTGTLEIFVTYDKFSSLYHFALYDSDDLNNFVGLIHEESTKYCQDPNVYQMLAAQHTAQTQYDISIRSTDSGSCEMIILAFAFSLPHVWIANITATSNAKYTFKNTVDDKKLFDIDASEVSQWQSFGIYTQALSIISPPSSGIAVHLTNADQTLAWITVIRDGTQKGVMSYNNNLLRTSDTLKLYQANNYEPNGIFTANFAVKEILGNPIVLIEHNGQNQT